MFQSYIPKTLDDVRNAEEDVQRITSGQDTGDMYYKTITGLKQALPISNPSLTETRPQEQSGEEDSPGPGNKLSDLDNAGEGTGSDEDESDLTDSEGRDSASENEQPSSIDRKAARKENKKKVKEEKREARKHKVPKAVKKKKKKLAKAKKYR